MCNLLSSSHEQPIAQSRVAQQEDPMKKDDG